MRQYLLLISSMYFFCSCDNKDKEAFRIKDSESTIMAGYIEKNKTDSLINQAININDTIAYNKAAIDFIMQNRGQDLLYYSMIMAYKNGSAEAYFHIYDVIAYSMNSKQPKSTLNFLGEKTKDFAMYHLLKSYEMGYGDAKYQILEQFRADEKVPSSSYYLKKYFEGELTK